MTSLTSIQLISGAVAGVIVIVATRAIERFGGILGGVISTLPTTVVVAGFGFALTIDDDDDFRRSMFVIPLGQLLDAGVLCIWRFLPAYVDHETHLVRSLCILVSANLLLWGVGGVAVYFLNVNGLDERISRMLPTGIGALVRLSTR